MLVEKTQPYQSKVKYLFDRKAKEDKFHPRDLVLKWDSMRDDKSKHGMFNHHWLGYFSEAESIDNNTIIMQSLDD